MYQAITIAGVAGLTTAVLAIYKNKSDEKFALFLKILTVVYCAAGFFRYMLSDSFMWVINDGVYGGVRYIRTDYLSTVMRWGYYLNYAILPMAVFFGNRLFKNVALYFCLPFTLLSVAFFNVYMGYFLDPAGKGFHLAVWFRYAYFIFELVLAGAVPLLLCIRSKHRFDFRNKKEIRNFLVCLPLFIANSMPGYVPQSIIGYTFINAKALSPFNVAWILSIALEIFVIYRVFRFKDYETRRAVCQYLAICLFFHYNSLFLMGFTINRLPIQLCNLGAYFCIIAVTFRTRKFFDFIFLANIVGGCIAVFSPDLVTGAFGFWTMHYMYEHSLVIVVPAVCMALRLFPRLKADALVHLLVGFACYFLFCVVSGTILNGYSDVTGTTVNFFYIFDLKKAFDYFPFLAFTSKYRIAFGRFELYPVLHLIIFCGYYGICTLFYFITQKIYAVADDHRVLRASLIDLYEKKTGKTCNLPLEYKD